MSSPADLPVTDIPSFATFNPADVYETAGIQFTSTNGETRPARLSAAHGPIAYHYVLPSENPVALPSSKNYSRSLMPGANDQTIACAPRVEILKNPNGPNSPWEQKLYAEPVLDGKFVGLSSGFYSDFVKIDGVSPPYISAGIDGIYEVAQANVSYFWQRVGDIVTLHGRVSLAGGVPADNVLKYVTFRLPIPLSENAPPFSGACTYICSKPTHCPVRGDTKARSHDARDPRFFGMAQMVQHFPLRNDGLTANYNEWPVFMWPIEWSRDQVYVAFDNTEQIISPEIQFSASYSLAPIMADGSGTKRRVIDNVPTDAVPDFEYN